MKSRRRLLDRLPWWRWYIVNDCTGWVHRYCYRNSSDAENRANSIIASGSHSACVRLYRRWSLREGDVLP